MLSRDDPRVLRNGPAPGSGQGRRPRSRRGPAGGVRALSGRGWTAAAWAVTAAALYVRLPDFGRYGFWNDEAWVALSTRVESLEQFWLSLSVTPVLWAGALRLWSSVTALPEFWLRLLPLGFSCLTLWAAYLAGRRFAAHALGGLLALAVIAFDPSSIKQATLLKHYSAEAFFSVLAFACATDAARGGRTELVRLGAALCLGAGFSNTQVLVAPPLLAALALGATARRDWRGLRRIALLAAAVGMWDVIAYRVLIAPRLSAALDAYWAADAPAGLTQAFGRTGERLAAQLRNAWGAAGAVLAVASLAAVGLLGHRQRVAVLGLVLLVVELVVVSLYRPLPADAPRVTLFLMTALNVYAAAAAGLVALRLWRQPRLRPLLPLGLALLAYGAAAQRPWAGLGRAPNPEDLGPLVRIVENARTSQDRVLLYARSTYVYAYYRNAPPVLVPAPTTVGYVPYFDDPRLVVVDGEAVDAALARALDESPRAWVLGSRFHAGDEPRFRDAARAHGQTVLEMRRPRALLMLVTR